METIASQRRMTFSQRTKHNQQLLSGQKSFNGTIPPSIGKIAHTQNSAALSTKSFWLGDLGKYLLVKSRTAATIAKLRKVKTWVHLVFNSSILLISFRILLSSSVISYLRPRPTNYLIGR